MEKLYRKLENGRYVEAGYSTPDISDGIWVVQTKPYSRSITSLAWKVGDLKRPVDIVTHASIQSMENELVSYLQKLSESDSKEFKEALKLCGGYLRGPVNYSNISPTDLVSLFLRQIAIHIESK